MPDANTGARLEESADFLTVRHTETLGLSLISFHRILIAVAILFCAGYGAFELVAFSRGGGNGALVISGVFFLFTALLAYYLWRLKRFLGVDE